MKLPLSKIKPNPKNPRLIKDDKFKRLVQSLKDFPEMADIREIVVNKDHIVLGGNMRLKAMQEAGWKEAPVKVVDWTQEKQDEFVVKDNASFGEWDWDELANQYEVAELIEWGVDLPESLLPEAEVEEDEAPEVSSEPAVSKLGKIYQLGRHRVMCGDSTDKASVELLMDGARADMVFTDPPYGINLDGDNSKRGKNTSLMKGGLKLDSFIDDSTSYAIDAWNICHDLKIPVQVWFGANYYCHSLPETNNWLVWDKRVEDKMTNTNSDCELAWVQDGHNSVRIFRHLWNGLIKASEKSDKRVHPTQKPMALAQFAFEKYDPNGKSVLDLFLGSGSTLIACEQTDRTCYGMELDEKYVDVIRKRWAKFTNNNELPDNWAELTPVV